MWLYMVLQFSFLYGLQCINALWSNYVLDWMVSILFVLRTWSFLCPIFLSIMPILLLVQSILHCNTIKPMWVTPLLKGTFWMLVRRAGEPCVLGSISGLLVWHRKSMATRSSVNRYGQQTTASWCKILMSSVVHTYSHYFEWPSTWRCHYYEQSWNATKHTQLPCSPDKHSKRSVIAFFMCAWYPDPPLCIFLSLLSHFSSTFFSHFSFVSPLLVADSVPRIRLDQDQGILSCWCENTFDRPGSLLSGLFVDDMF